MENPAAHRVWLIFTNKFFSDNCAILACHDAFSRQEQKQQTARRKDLKGLNAPQLQRGDVGYVLNSLRIKFHFHAASLSVVLCQVYWVHLCVRPCALQMSHCGTPRSHASSFFSLSVVWQLCLSLSAVVCSLPTLTHSFTPSQLISSPCSSAPPPTKEDKACDKC